MGMLSDVWGLSLNETLLLMAAILIVMDFFIPADIPTHIAYIILCVLTAINIDAHFLWKILCALVAWFALVAFHYTFWQAVMQKVANSVIAPDRYRAGADGLVGSEGIVRIIEGDTMVRVKGDVWPCRAKKDLAEGVVVTVVSVEDGELEVVEKRSE